MVQDYQCVTDNFSPFPTRKCIPVTEYNRLLRELRTNTSAGSITVLGVMRIVAFVLLVLSFIVYLVFRRSKYLKYSRLGCAFGVAIFMILILTNGILLIDLIPSRVVFSTATTTSTNSTSTNSTTSTGKNSTKSLSSLQEWGVPILYDIGWSAVNTFSPVLHSMLATNTSKNNTTTTNTTVNYATINLRTIPLVKRTSAMWSAQPQELLSETICFIHLGLTSLLHWFMVLCIPLFVFMNFIVRSYLERKKLKIVKILEKENQRVNMETIENIPQDSSDGSERHFATRPYLNRDSIGSASSYDNSLHQVNTYQPSRLFGDSINDHRAYNLTQSIHSNNNELSSSQMMDYMAGGRRSTHSFAESSTDGGVTAEDENTDGSCEQNLSSFGTSFMREPKRVKSSEESGSYDEEQPGIPRDPPVSRMREPSFASVYESEYSSTKQNHLDRSVTYVSDEVTSASGLKNSNNNLSGTVLGLTKKYRNQATGESVTLSGSSSLMTRFTTTTFVSNSGRANNLSTMDQSIQSIEGIESRKSLLFWNFFVRHPNLFQTVFISSTALIWFIIHGLFIGIMLGVQNATSCDSMWYVTQRVWYAGIMTISLLTLISLLIADMVINERHSDLKRKSDKDAVSIELDHPCKRFGRFLVNYFWYHDLLWFRREALLFCILYAIAMTGFTITDILIFVLKTEELVVRVYTMKLVITILFEIPFVLLTPTLVAIFTIKRQYHVSRLQEDFLSNQDEYLNKSVKRRRNSKEYMRNVENKKGSERNAIIEQTYDLSVYHPTETILRQILKHSELSRIFQEFLQRELSISNLLIYKAIKEYLALKEREKITKQRQKLYHIYYNFICPSSTLNTTTGCSHLLNMKEYLSEKLVRDMKEVMDQLEEAGRSTSSAPPPSDLEAQIDQLLDMIKNEVLFNLLDAYTRFFIECKEFERRFKQEIK